MAAHPPEPPDLTASKREWRRWARELPAVPPDIARAVADQLVVLLADVTDPVLGYLGLPDEVDIDRVWFPGALATTVALPRLRDDGTMALYLDEGGRETHATGITQPTADASVIDPGVLGAVVVPGRLFDRAGYRLGRGGGHYDRLLPHLDPTVPVIGVTTAARIVDELPREWHDRPMTHLVTEAGVISTRPPSVSDGHFVENEQPGELDS